MGNFIDVSHTVEHGMTTYKGLPPPTISVHQFAPSQLCPEVKQSGSQ